MIGNPITDGSLVATSATGWIRVFDLTNQGASRIYQAQMEKTGPDQSAVITSAVSESVLFGYLDAVPASGDFAFYADGPLVYLWGKTATYPNDSTSRVAFWYERDSFEYAADSDLYDHYQESEHLCTLLALKNALLLKGESVPRTLTEEVASELSLLGLS